MKILITTGIYPPKIGGPAQYAKQLREQFESRQLLVRVETFNIEDRLPTGIRHLFFFFKILPRVVWADRIIALDTMSVGLPTAVAARIFFKKFFIRTGGDFLWEQYIERTHKKVLLKNFYQTEKAFFSPKERLIFLLTRWLLKISSCVVFSTEWQLNIFTEAYDLDKYKTSVIENYYGPKESNEEINSAIFVASSRNIFLKNIKILVEVFKKFPEATLFLDQIPFSKFMEKLKYSYAVIVPSLSEVSSNLILDAIRFNRPFICTKEIGIYERIKGAGIFVDPLDGENIASAVNELLSKEGYKKAKEKVEAFDLIHSWEEIAEEFLGIFKRI